MPSAGIEPAFQASEACVLSVAPRGPYVINRFYYMTYFIPLQEPGLKQARLGSMNKVEISTVNGILTIQYP